MRVSAVFKPIDGLTITPSYFYQKLRAGGLPYIDSIPGTDAHYQPFDIAENYRDEFHLEALSIKYRTDVFEISSATAYWTRHEPLIQDASESWSTGLGLAVRYGPGNGGIGAAYADEDNQSHQTTEELRVASVGDTRLKWLVGYFYSDFESGWDIIFPSQTGADVFGSNNLFSYYSPFKILQQSVFGELTYNITEPFAVTVGARRYHYDAPVELDQYGALTATVVTTHARRRTRASRPKVSLSYQFDKDLLVYATAAKGFRPGGGTGPVPTSGPLSCEAQLMAEYGSKGFVNGPISFNSDSVWSYELGEKWRSSDNRFSVNASAYFESWMGVQQVNALSSCGYVYTANVGDAHVYGGEIEVRAIVVHDLEASANVTYSHAALVSATLIDAGFNPGTPIQQVPQWSGSARARLPPRPDRRAGPDGPRRVDLRRQPHGRDLRHQHAALLRSHQYPRRIGGRALVRRAVRQQRRRQARAPQQHHAGRRQPRDLQPGGGEPAAHHGHRPQLQVQVIAKPAAEISIRRRARRALALAQWLAARIARTGSGTLQRSM